MSSLKLKDRTSCLKEAGRFTTIELDCQKVLKDWRASLFAFEWLGADGLPKHDDDLLPEKRARLHEAQSAFDKGQEIERPLCGIGIYDTVEIAVGQAVFIVLIRENIPSFETHILASQKDDFEKYKA